MPHLIQSTTRHVALAARRRLSGHAAVSSLFRLARRPGAARINLRLVLACAAAAGISACATQGPGMAVFSQGALPDAVKVPSGHRVVLETVASGDIQYECRARKDAAGQFEWAFVGPNAGLRDRKGALFGKYYGPPATWESNDGSRVSGAQLAVAGAGSADIPLQLVKVSQAAATGVLQGVTFIQRVNTRGGVAPSQLCAAPQAGQMQRVPYAADYVFWRPV